MPDLIFKKKIIEKRNISIEAILKQGAYWSQSVTKPCK